MSVKYNVWRHSRRYNDVSIKESLQYTSNNGLQRIIDSIMRIVEGGNIHGKQIFHVFLIRVLHRRVLVYCLQENRERTS